MQLVWTENADPFCDDDHFQPKKKAIKLGGLSWRRVVITVSRLLLGNDVEAVCLGQKQREKTKGKGRCQCHARCEGQGENYGCRFHGSPLFSLFVPEQAKDIRDRRHVLELFGNQGGPCSTAGVTLRSPHELGIRNNFGISHNPTPTHLFP